MVFFNWATMQMAAKIVYYGPGLCGKTTNLSYIYAKTSPNSRGEMVSLETESDRTLFFDLLPIEVGTIGGFRTRLQLYTVPGQVFYNTTRKLVLKGVDGVVFVADSQRPMREANIESFANLRENLTELGVDLDEIPLVLQYNKRDLKHILTLDELTADLNPESLHPFAESSAILGDGVFETLKAITKLTLRKLRSRMATPEATPQPRVEAPPVIPRVPAEAGTTISAASLARAAEEGVEEKAQEEPAAAEPHVAAVEAEAALEEAPVEAHEVSEPEVAAELPAAEVDEPVLEATETGDWDGPLPDDVTQPNPMIFAEDVPAPTPEPEALEPAAPEPEVAAAEPTEVAEEPEELGGDDIVEPEEALAEVAEPAEAPLGDAEDVAPLEAEAIADEPVPFELPEEAADAEAEPEVPPPAPEEPEPTPIEATAADEDEIPPVEEAPTPALDEVVPEEETPPADVPAPAEAEEAAADVEVNFEQQEQVAEVSPPPIKRVQVSSQMDILAELDTLRKQATNGSFAPTPQSAENMDLDSLLSGEPDARKELRHAIAKSLNSGIFKKMRTMQLAIRIQDSGGETIQTLDPIAMEVEDAGSLSHLSLKFTLDLENDG